MREFYIHKVGKQERGSMVDANSRPARGQYFYISKKAVQQGFFDSLSKDKLNANRLISIVPLQDGRPTEIVESVLDYHNSKYDEEWKKSHLDTENPRNEYRIYTRNKLDSSKLYYQKDDIIVFEKYSFYFGIVYTLSRFREGDTGYAELSSMLIKRIKDRKTKRFKKKIETHLLHHGELSYVRRPLISEFTPICVETDAEDLIRERESLIIACLNEGNVEEAERLASVYTRTYFRKRVLENYNYRCAITGEVIRHDDIMNIDAAHIKPESHNGTFLPCNGIALSKDLHFAFDNGFITINPDFSVEVKPEMIGTAIYKYNGMIINVPEGIINHPNGEFLKYHKNYVFPNFGPIRRK